MFLVQDNCSSFTLDTGLSDIADGNWHHYALTAKKTISTKTVLDLYVDGCTLNQQIDTDTIKSHYWHNGWLPIGSLAGLSNFSNYGRRQAGAILFLLLLMNLDIGKQKETLNKLADFWRLKLAAAQTLII